jgi:hypothetical protein
LRAAQSRGRERDRPTAAAGDRGTEKFNANDETAPLPSDGRFDPVAAGLRERADPKRGLGAEVEGSGDQILIRRIGCMKNPHSAVCRSGDRVPIGMNRMTTVRRGRSDLFGAERCNTWQ